MAAVGTIKHDIPVGQTQHLYTGTIAFDASYPTGGEAVDFSSNAKMDTLIASPTAGYVFSWDAANQKLLAYRQKDPANAGGADIPLPEVAASADLSALTAVPFIAVGS